MSIPKEKTREEEAQTPRSKRGLYVVFIAVTVIAMLSLSIGGFFLHQANGKDSKLTTGTLAPTPTPSSTVIYLETPPPQAVFYDTFKNNALGWGLSSTSGYIRTLRNGSLTLSNTNPGTTLIESLPTNAIYDNYVVSVDLTVVNEGSNDSAGIYVRGDSNMDHDYRIDFNGDDTFDIAKEYLDSRNDSRSTLLDGPRSSLMLNPQGSQNSIKLVMTERQLVLFINNKRVSSIMDGDYTTGQVALFARAGEGSTGVTVSFSRVEVDLPGGKVRG